MTSWQPDDLGPGFEQLTLPLPAGAPATLVRRVGDGADWPPSALSGADVLYVHGWSDYFFQHELADFWHRAGANFYALDLHHFGRSLRPGMLPGQVQELGEYDVDIAAALAAMGRAPVATVDLPEVPELPAEPAPLTEPEETPWLSGLLDTELLTTARTRLEAAFTALTGREHPAPTLTGERPLILLGHSTGGLILSLWAARHPGAASAVILNSPWLEFQASEVGRAVMTPFVQARSRFRPLTPLPAVDPGFYSRAVAKKFGGEWEYNAQWRPDRGFPVTPSFLNTVFAGQATVARGLHLGVPVLVLLSDRSYLQPRWSATAQAADVVLNVDTVARRALDLGPDVTLHRVPGAFHDIFLSPPAIRSGAYAGMGRWAEAALDTASARRWADRGASTP